MVFLCSFLFVVVVVVFCVFFCCCCSCCFGERGYRNVSIYFVALQVDPYNEDYISQPILEKCSSKFEGKQHHHKISRIPIK